MSQRANIYTRLNSGKPVEGTGLESQLEACQKEAAQLGAAVLGVHQDAGISGALRRGCKPPDNSWRRHPTRLTF